MVYVKLFGPVRGPKFLSDPNRIWTGWISIRSDFFLDRTCLDRTFRNKNRTGLGLGGFPKNLDPLTSSTHRQKKANIKLKINTKLITKKMQSRVRPLRQKIVYFIEELER